MDFGDLFTRAWRIVWHNKLKFVLGFLASLGAGRSFRTGNFTNSFDEGPSDIGLQLRTFLGLVYGIVVFAITLPLAAIALLPLIISVLVETSFGISEFFLLACGGLIVALIISALNSWLVAFRSAVVTLAYQEFQEKKVQ